MPLFQKSVEKKHLNDLDKNLIDEKYQAFLKFFGDAEIQENIRNSNEEQFQEGFLRELFVNILGYTLNPNPHFNLTTELKNIGNTKKTDGAILKGPDAIAVIELKSTGTTDLDMVEAQAFGYKNHHPKCTYVITSNFEKLRFYIQNAVEYIEFDLFNMSKEQFARLWLCLFQENIFKDLPLHIKESSVLTEENVTKKLYADYSTFRSAIYTNLVENNPETDKLLLFKKTQKLLDRFLFLFFAEDRLLLPPNSISEIIKQWNDLKDKYDEYFPLYNRFKKYFGYLNTGYKGKQYNIFPYNGGLFAPDEILDNLKMDDEILYEHTLKLSSYDFETEIDVNILGHIFEHSLGEIENVQAEIKGQAVDRQKSKRKKDGIFYTPKYITKYIVENTVGKLCEEKRKELEIVDKEFRPNRQKNTKKKLLETLDSYREWLLELTILDPACGSGAFLNQALEFLINEHHKIDKLKTNLLGGGLVFSDIETDILEKNIFGVDLNEESVEIAKLSLWLRTARKGRKLNTLSNNIKCGNSLIDDPAVAGEKAFNWYKEFPNIFREKEKKAFHITWVTHNSRTSQRMIVYKVKKGEPFWLPEEYEVVVAQTLKDIIEQDNLNVMACNICGDHVHVLLVCEEQEVSNIVRKLKGKSSQKLKEYLHIPKEEKFTLWAQKYDNTFVNSEEHLNNAVEYIRNNRIKHKLQEPSDTNCSYYKGHSSNSVDKGNSTYKGHPSGSVYKGLQPLVPGNAAGKASFHKASFGKALQRLADSPAINQSYDHAFRTEYKGGFDVVIGNPPYVQLQAMGEMSNKLKKSGFETFHKGADLYCLFTEQGYKLLKKGGLQSFIMPNKWLVVAYGQPLRKFLADSGLRQILNFGDIQFFEQATTYVCIFVVEKSKQHENVKVLSLNRKTYHGDFATEVNANFYDYSASNFDEKQWSIQPLADSKKLEKMKQNGTKLRDLPITIYRGILTGYNDAFYIDKESRQKLIKADAKSKELIKPMLRGRDIVAYGRTSGEFILNVHNGIKDKEPPLEPVNIDDYRAIKEHLDAYYPKLEKRGDKGITPYNLRNCAYLEEFDNPKIIYPNMTSLFPFMYDESGILGNQKCFILTASDNSVSLLFLTALFNSSLAKLWIWYNCPELQGGTREISKVYFEHFPVPDISDEQKSTIEQLAKERIRLTDEHQTKAKRFIKRLETNLELAKQTAKLNKFYEYDFKTLIAELKKQKIKLSLAAQDEWEEYFTEHKTDINTVQAQIDQTDKEIDQMVYKLYGLA